MGRSEEGKPELRSHPLRAGGADLEWLGAKYSLVNQDKDFTEHEQKLLKSIGKVLPRRDYQLLFNAEVVARSSEISQRLAGRSLRFSGFLDPYVFAGAATLAKVTLIAFPSAIELLRISALSTYEDRRISEQEHCCLDFTRMPATRCLRSPRVPYPIRAS